MTQATRCTGNMWLRCLALLLGGMTFTGVVVAQGQTAAKTSATMPQPAASARAQAPFDLDGYWGSLVTEDWQYRMVLPQRGDYAGVPLSLAAKQSADAWNRAADEAFGKQCEAYGAAAIMLIPEHLHIRWQDDNTLSVQTDAGMQTRLLRFGAAPAVSAASWQGDSAAQWMLQPPAAVGNFQRSLLGFRQALAPGATSSDKAGQLRIDTGHMLPGLLRKNGLPYSDQAHLREYWEVDTDPATGQGLLVDTGVLSDPLDLHEDYIFTAIFEKLPDAARWHPQTCTLD